uniref:aldehyde dehydrogenase (NAD(+)) n=1 Tax=Haemonchus placei TaxID=6290 RepID=A0A0N4WCT4_HAEPC
LKLTSQFLIPCFLLLSVFSYQAANEALTPNSPWRRMDGEQRAHLLLKVANFIERDKNILASLESLDNGKPFMTAYEVDLPLSIECIRYLQFNCCLHTESSVLKAMARRHYANYARMMGDAPTAPRVCGEIIPWISPLLSLTWKFAPALATGNTVVMKLPERTPLSGLHVAGLIREADFPDGVFNVVVGVRAKAGRALVTHKDVDGMASIKFLRKAIEEASQSSIKKVPIEVNARSSCIVFADSNLKLAVKQAHYGIFFSNGRGYSVGSRTFVESKVYDEFVDRSKDLAERLIVGDPFEPSTQQGPQIDGHQVEEILRHVESGKRDGAHLVTGGTKWGDRGHYVLPTVLANVDDHMAIAKEEADKMCFEYVSHYLVHEVSTPSCCDECSSHPKCYGTASSRSPAIASTCSCADRTTVVANKHLTYFQLVIDPAHALPKSSWAITPRSHRIGLLLQAEVQFTFYCTFFQIIGPVMKLIRFDSMEDLLEKYSVAQNSQPVVVITKDADRARFIAQHTLSGSLW